MELTGIYIIPAHPDAVWAALNDPETLKVCIPGCESVTKTGPTEFLAKTTLKIGPMKATFTGKVVLAEVDIPRRCVLRGEGQGGVAGFAKGEAEVRLAEDGDGTVLTYTAKASVGGKLAQIGQRLIDATARQITDEFFSRFAASLTSRKSAIPEQPVAAKPIPQRLVALREGLPSKIWVAGLLALIAILLFVFGVFM